MPTVQTADLGLKTYAAASPVSFSATTQELELVAALRRGDESAFSRLVSAHHTSLLRVSRMYVGSQAVAEEVVQETWLGVLRGLDRFEGRCSLKTWIFRILVNRAKTRGERESRMIPFSAMSDPEAETGEPAVDPSEFTSDDSEQPGMWVKPVREWGANPEQWLLSKELKAHTEAAIAALPPSQREVITLRDVWGCTAEEVCNALSIRVTNQRVLLHRARCKVRQALDGYYKAR